MSYRASAVAAALATLAVAAMSGPALATPPRASLTDIENDVMCVACHESLAVSESPQANSERDFIRMLIAQGQTKAQIEQALVAQYGPAVLARPPAHGFNLTVYIIPPALVLIGIATLAVALPRWRRRARRGTNGTASVTPALGSVDARRLDEDLARYD